MSMCFSLVKELRVPHQKNWIYKPNETKPCAPTHRGSHPRGLSVAHASSVFDSWVIYDDVLQNIWKWDCSCQPCIKFTPSVQRILEHRVLQVVQNKWEETISPWGKPDATSIQELHALLQLPFVSLVWIKLAVRPVIGQRAQFTVRDINLAWSTHMESLGHVSLLSHCAEVNRHTYIYSQWGHRAQEGSWFTNSTRILNVWCVTHVCLFPFLLTEGNVCQMCNARRVMSFAYSFSTQAKMSSEED